MHLTPELHAAAKSYVALRYSHWTRKARRRRFRLTLHALARATEERREKYLADVYACRARHSDGLPADAPEDSA